MSTNDDLPLLNSVTRINQIIAGALIAGVGVFLGISVVLAPMMGGQPGVGPQAVAASMDIREILTWGAVAMAAATLPLSFLVPGWITDQNRRRIAAGTWRPPSGMNVNAPGTAAPFGPEALESDMGKLAFIYPMQFILGAALNEGAAFFASVVYLLGKNPIALGVALLLLIVLVLRFPTRLRIASWIDRQQELLIQDRQAAF